LENPSRKVLIFTYYWPPASGPGVQRFLKFAKYFPEYGWQPIVITPKDGSYPYYDETLLYDIPANMEIHHTKTLEPFGLYNFLRGAKGKSVPVAMTGIKDSNSLLQKMSKYIRANYFIPDARIGWNKYAIKKANEIISNTEINAIITTGPPQSSHLIGLHLKKTHKLPWIADFRDPWTTVYYNKFLPRSSSSIRKDKKLENIVLENADIVTTVSPGIKNEFEDRAKRSEVIYNGFDENDIYSSKLSPTPKFRLSYIGNYKPNQDVEALWLAIKELKEEIADFAENFNLSFTGIVDPNIIARINDLGLVDILETNTFVTHSEANNLMFNTNLLLFVIPQGSNNQVILTGKIFEYLASRSPMLSIGPTDGNASEVINESGRDQMIAYEDKEVIKKVILDYYEKWQHHDKMPFKHENNDYQRFSRKELTKQYSSLLNTLIS